MLKIIKTQKQFDKIKEVKNEDEIIVECEVKLNSILNVYGKITFNKKTDCSFYEKRYVEAWGNSYVKARENSYVVAWGNSSVEAWGNSSVKAWGNSSVKAWENSVIRTFSELSKIVLYGFSVLFKDIKLKSKIKVKSKNAVIQEIKQLPYLEREGVKVKKGKVILYKRVSKDFKTQEKTDNETLWEIGKTLEHKNWNPKEDECGEGKFHACSKPYFCDEFRNNKEDRYIAIEIDVKDLYEWKNPFFSHKIAFKKGRVLYECNKFKKK